jgi:hypothetical protein
MVPDYARRIRTGAAAGAHAVGKLKVTAAGLLVFACGLSATYAVEIVGRVYLAELVLPLVGLIVALTGRPKSLTALREFWIICAALLAMLAGYVLSDLIAGTPEAQSLKGLGRVLFVITDFLALAFIVAADRANLRWFVLGLGLGGLAVSRFVDHMPMMSPFGWKFGYAAAAIFTLAGVVYSVPKVVATAGFVVLGVLSMFLDARAYSALCLLLAALLWTRAERTSIRPTGTGGYVKLAVGAAVALGAVFFLLKSTENSWTQERRAQSSVGRFLYLQIGAEAIFGSPLIGYGSWGQSREIAEVEKRVLLESNDRHVRDNEITGNALSMHSQILQSWLEGGLGAGCFFLTYVFLLLKAARQLLVARGWDALSPAMMFIVFNGLWHSIMSPFTAVHRLDIAMGCVVVVALAMERALQKRGRRKVMAPVTPDVRRRLPAGQSASRSRP